MAERMVGTQIYLPPKMHAELKRRAGKHGLTLALQIREALEDYLRRTNGDEDEMEPLDLGNLLEITGRFRPSGWGAKSLAEESDCAGRPAEEEALERERL